MVLNVPEEYNSSCLMTVEIQIVFFWVLAFGLAVEFQRSEETTSVSHPEETCGHCKLSFRFVTTFHCEAGF